MTNMTKRAIAACAGTIALACAVIQPAQAADMPPYPPQYSGPPEYPPQYGGPPAYPRQYGGPPVVQERYVYQEPPPVYRAVPQPPPVYSEYAPPALVPVPEPYYVPPRRVYVDPGYGGYGYGYRPYVRPYVAGGYGYYRGWGHGPRRW